MPRSDEEVGSVIAVAGRRIDSDNAGEKRFPYENVSSVRDALTALFTREDPIAVVASGACGGDLIALQAADALGIRTRIVLPFPPERFRQTSVIDRPHPEHWGPLFDRLVSAARARGDLVVLANEADDGSAYSAANRAIVAEANALAHEEPPRRRVAVIVWDGAARGPTDATKEFADLAAAMGFRVRELSSLGRRDLHQPGEVGDEP